MGGNPPASANTCGGSIPQLCLHHLVTGLPDVFGEPRGWGCAGAFYYVGQEGAYDYYRGPIAGATYVHPDPETRRMTVTCSVRSGSTYTTGTQRGTTTASSVAPLNNVVSATGVDLTFYETFPGEQLYLCTTVAWVDKVGLSHSQRLDYDSSVAGTQCGKFVDLPI